MVCFYSLVTSFIICKNKIKWYGTILVSISSVWTMEESYILFMKAFLAIMNDLYNDQSESYQVMYNFNFPTRCPSIHWTSKTNVQDFSNFWKSQPTKAYWLLSFSKSVPPLPYIVFHFFFFLLSDQRNRPAQHLRYMLGILK